MMHIFWQWQIRHAMMKIPDKLVAVLEALSSTGEGCAPLLVPTGQIRISFAEDYPTHKPANLLKLLPSNLGGRPVTNLLRRPSIPCSLYLANHP